VISAGPAADRRRLVVRWLAFAVAALITVGGVLVLGTYVTDEEGETCGTAWGITVHGMDTSGGEPGYEAEHRESERQCKGPARRLALLGVPLVAVGAAMAGVMGTWILHRRGR
jgi:hypothetical protein